MKTISEHLSACEEALRNGLAEATPRPDYLYHYTSVETATKIVSNGELQATDASYFSDRQDTRVADDLLARLLQEHNADHEPAIEVLRARLNGRRLTDQSGFESSASIFAACLTENGDLLSQWRGYAKHYGCAVAFSTKLISAAVADAREWRVGRCIYDPQEQESFVRGWLNGVLERARSEGAELVAGRSGAPHFAWLEFLLMRTFFKHSSFVEEGEWRIAWIAPSAAPTPLTRPEFREGAKGPIPYRKLEFSHPQARTDESGAEIGIIVGPRQAEEMLERDVFGMRRWLNFKGSSHSNPDDAYWCEPSTIPFSPET